MSPAKHIVVIGLGSFGTAVAVRLAENRCRVTGVDSQRERVEALKDVLYEAVIADATQRDALELLPLKTADSVIISMGENITLSLLATLHVKELGASRVVVKGVTHEHGKILEKLGVSRVVFPEEEIARQLADRETWTNVFDALPIGEDYSFVEIAVPDSFVGKTLQETQIARRFGVLVVGVRDSMEGGQVTITPSAEYKFKPDQILLMIGEKAKLERLREQLSESES